MQDRQRRQPVKHPRRQRGEIAPYQSQLCQQLQLVKHPRGQRGERIVVQEQDVQRLQIVKHPCRQPGELHVGQLQVPQPVQRVEVEVAKLDDALMSHDHITDRVQVGQGGLHAGFPPERRHNGIADRRGAETDGRWRDQERDGLPGRGAAAVGDGRGVGGQRAGHRRRADEPARGGQRQPGGQSGKRVAQRKPAAGGDHAEPGHRKAHREGLRDKRRSELQGGIVVPDVDRHARGGRDAVVAAHQVGDGGGVVVAVTILAHRHGDRPGGAPVRGGEGQGTADAHVGVGGDNAERHRRAAGWGGVQTHGVGGHAVFLHVEGGGGHDDPGLHHRHGEGQGRRIRPRRVDVRIHGGPGQRRGGRGGRGAGQREPVAVKAQPGQHGRQGIAQGAIATGGGWQHQRRNRLAGEVALGGDQDRAERWRGVVLHREDKTQGVRIAFCIGDDPAQTGRDGTDGGAGQDPRVGINGQPGRNGGQGIPQRVIAAGRSRQRQGRHRHPCKIEQQRQSPGGEARRGVGVGAGDQDCQIDRRSVIAADRMADGETGHAIRALARRDGDDSGRRPVRGCPGQGAGDGHPAVGRADARGHRHRAGGHGVQPQGVRGRAALGHLQAGAGNDHLWLRRGEHQPEAGDAAAGEPGIAERELSRRVTEQPERLAGPLPRRDGGGAGDPVGGRPRDGDLLRGGLLNPHPALAIGFLQQVNGQGQRVDRVPGQIKNGQGIQPVKQAGRQGFQPVVGQTHTPQRVKPGEESPRQGLESGSLHRHKPQRTKPGKQARRHDPERAFTSPIPRPQIQGL